MELAIVAIAVGLAVWFGRKLFQAGDRIDTLLDDIERVRAEKVGLLAEINRLHAIYRPAPTVKAPPTDEQYRDYKRRFHHRQAVDNALKWDDTWGPQ